jgi:hypothetical protein
MKLTIKPIIQICSICILLLCLNYTQAQDIQSTYKILLNGGEIGAMNIHKSSTSDKTEFSLESKAKKRFVISFEIYEKHNETFQNNIMTTASMYRQVNGKTKINSQMNFTGTNYQIASGGKTTSISVKPVSWSLLNLYFAEPVNITEAFSDSFQQMLKIESIGNHTYKISLPDGNSNYFYYINGVCTKEVINHSFYKVELVPVSN